MLPPLFLVFRDRLQQVTNDTQTQGKEIQLVRKWFSRRLITTPWLGTCGCEETLKWLMDIPEALLGPVPLSGVPFQELAPLRVSPRGLCNMISHSFDQ